MRRLRDPENRCRLASRIRGKEQRGPRSERGRDLMEAYCVKCRGQKEIKAPTAITMSNGRPAMQGTCPICGTKLTRIVKKTVQAK